MTREKLFIPVSILIVFAGLWWLYGEYTALSTVAHENERQQTVSYIQAKATPYVASGEFLSGDPSVQRAAFSKFFTDIQSPKLFRIKVWSEDKVILWSDLTDIIGRQYADNKEVASAFAGTPTISIGQPKLEHVSERQLVQLLEVYAPIYDTDGTIFLVIETYAVGEDISSDIAEGLWVQALLAFAVVIVLIIIARLALRPTIKTSHATRL